MVLRTHISTLFLFFFPLAVLSQYLGYYGSHDGPSVTTNAADGSFWVIGQSDTGAAPTDTWWTGCFNNTKANQRNLTLAHTIGTQACLDWYYWGGLVDTWEGTLCNNLGFFRGSNQYSDSRACYEKCYGCLSESIVSGSTDAMCRDAHGYGAVDVRMGRSREVG
ncbi:MAG: hypothetical protein LQ352_008307, partial [Teloschistes flavicans]